MNSRERFLETMNFGTPDRAPRFDEGIRDDVEDAWRAQGLLPEAELSEIFHLDKREEISPDLYPSRSLVEYFASPFGLDGLRRSLDPNDPDRLPDDWSDRVRSWKMREHALMLEVHEGFFLSLGVGEWASFAEAIYLFADQPEFVRQALMIQGEFCANIAERVLKEVQIDAVIFSEPIGGNHGALISPQTYREFMLPSFEPLFDVFARYDVEIIILRTYANTRVLLPVFFEQGFNCLWACECNPQAMDYQQIRQEFGRDLRLIGGIDLDVLRGKKEDIRRDLLASVPPLLAQGGFVPLADGRVRADISFENYQYYRRLLNEIIDGVAGLAV